jgi:hypothetical protein
MPRVVRSAKGQEVNFDMLKIKQQIASAPKPTSVKAREDFIDQKFKRRLKRLKRGVAQKAADETAKEEPKVEQTNNNSEE